MVRRSERAGTSGRGWYSRQHRESWTCQRTREFDSRRRTFCCGAMAPNTLDLWATSGLTPHLKPLRMPSCPCLGFAPWGPGSEILPPGSCEREPAQQSKVYYCLLLQPKDLIARSGRQRAGRSNVICAEETAMGRAAEENDVVRAVGHCLSVFKDLGQMSFRESPKSFGARGPGIRKFSRQLFGGPDRSSDASVPWNHRGLQSSQAGPLAARVGQLSPTVLCETWQARGAMLPLFFASLSASERSDLVQRMLCRMTEKLLEAEAPAGLLDAPPCSTLNAAKASEGCA